MTSKPTRRKPRFEGLTLPSILDATPAPPGIAPAPAVPVADYVREAGQRLTEDYRRLRQLEQSGRVELELPLASIRPSRFANRSEHYFHSARYAEIRSSIAQHGVKIPIKVRPVADSTSPAYEIVYGHTRHRASLDLGLPSIRAVVEALDDETLLAEMELENRDREDLSAYERARFYALALADTFAGNRERLCARFGRSNAWLSQQRVIAGLPQRLFDAMPLLYQAGVEPLLELARLRPTDEQVQTLIEMHPDASSPTTLVQVLIRRLHSASRGSPKRTTASAEAVHHHRNGRLLMHARPGTRGRVQFEFESGQRGFADFLRTRLAELYDEYEKSQAGEKPRIKGL